MVTRGKRRGPRRVSPVKGRRIVSAPTDRIDRQGPIVQLFLSGVLDRGECYVTDEVRLFDFYHGDDWKDWFAARSLRAFELYGIKFEPHEYLVDVIDRLIAAQALRGDK